MTGRRARQLLRRVEPQGAMLIVGAQVLTPTAANQIAFGHDILRACFCPECRTHYMGVPSVTRREPRVLHIPCTNCKVRT